MNGEEIAPILATLILIIPFCLWIFFKYQIKLRILDQETGQSERIILQKEMKEVKERLMIIEKIITDKGYQVDEEIAKLKSVK